MEPQNGSLEEDVPFQRGDFQVPAVSFRGKKMSQIRCCDAPEPQKTAQTMCRSVRGKSIRSPS